MKTTTLITFAMGALSGFGPALARPHCGSNVTNCGVNGEIPAYSQDGSNYANRNDESQDFVDPSSKLPSGYGYLRLYNTVNERIACLNYQGKILSDPNSPACVS